ncbi:MAG TPA: hypothetical protein VEY50_10260 [Lysobacter sp.]|nr:hypothetical protein [Lysobacter sp.]
MNTPRDRTQDELSAAHPSPHPQTPSPEAAELDPTAGMAREVGDLDDPDAEQRDGALPGRMGGGLAGG